MRSKRQAKGQVGKVQDDGDAPAVVAAPPPNPQSVRAERQTEVFQRTKMCKFHLLGVCLRGAECKYAHSVLTLQAPPDLFRTKLCKTLLATGSCKEPDCRYAHTKEELRTMPSRSRNALAVATQSTASTTGSDSEVLPDPVKVRVGSLSHSRIPSSSSGDSLDVSLWEQHGDSFWEKQAAEEASMLMAQAAGQMCHEDPTMQGLENMWYGTDAADGTSYLDYSTWHPEMGHMGFGDDAWQWGLAAGGYGMDFGSCGDFAELQAAAELLLAAEELGGYPYMPPATKEAKKLAQRSSKRSTKVPLDSFEPIRIPLDIADL
jgi:hypothetical protein